MTDTTVANLNDIAANGGVQNDDMFYVLRTGTPDADFKASAGDLLDFVEAGATAFSAATHTHLLADISDAGDLASMNTVSSAEIDSKAVTYAKLQDLTATDKLLGRASSGAGVVEEITCTAAARALLDDVSAGAMRTTLGLATIAATGAYADLSGTPGLGALAAKSSVDLSSGDATGTLAASRFPALAGDVTTTAGSLSATIANNAVTNAKAAQMASGTIKGNNTGGAANAIDLTATQVTALLNSLVGDTGSGGTKGLVPAPSSGDAAAGKFLKADGTWSVPAGGGGSGDNADSMWFGDGSDGNVTLSSGTTTLTRDMYYNDLTISGTGSMNTGMFRIFVAGTLDLSAAPANAIITPAPGNGGNGNGGSAAGTAGAATTTIGTVLAGRAGVAGSAGNAAAGTTPTASIGTQCLGGFGGCGGNGEKGGNSSSVNGALNTAIVSGPLGIDPRYPSTSPLWGFTTTYFAAMGGNGGCGGAGDGTAAGGGGGGGAGGNGLMVFANTINRGGSTASGAISSTGANGGNGGTPSTGNRGGGMGGCGGGGAYISIIYKTLTGTTATNMVLSKGGNGGNGGIGTGTGTGGYGGAGGKGGVIALVRIGGGVSVTTGTRTVSPVALAGGANSGLTGGSGATGESLYLSL